MQIGLFKYDNKHNAISLFCNDSGCQIIIALYTLNLVS